MMMEHGAKNGVILEQHQELLILNLMLRDWDMKNVLQCACLLQE